VSGPIFATTSLWRRINARSPKTQDALLEAMQERQGRQVQETMKTAATVLVIRDAEETRSSRRHLPAHRSAASTDFMFNVKGIIRRQEEEQLIVT